MYYTYAIENTVDDMVYIGATGRSVDLRLKEHIKLANSGNKDKLYAHMRNVGINNFNVRVICETERKSEAYNLETYYAALSKDNLLNMTPNGKASFKGRDMYWGQKTSERLKGKVPCYNTKTQKNMVVSREEYDSSDFLVGRTSGGTSGINILTGESRTYTTQERNENKAILNPNEKLFYKYDNKIWRQRDILVETGYNDIRKVIRYENASVVNRADYINFIKKEKQCLL